MGRWFATFLKRNGYRVIISDKNRSAARKLTHKNGFRLAEDQLKAAQSAQLVILATPTQVTKKILEEIAPYLSRTLLVEISSVKEPLRKKIQQLQKRGIAILSIHPLFGPGAETLQGRTVLAVSIPPRNASATKLLTLMKQRGARIIPCDFNEHENLASILLSLPHFINMALVSTLRSMAVDPNRLREAGGSTFKLQLLIAEAVHDEDLGNEISILADNKRSLHSLRLFAQQSNAILRMVERREREDMLRTLINGRRYVRRDEAFASAYSRFNAAVEVSGFAEHHPIASSR